MIKNKDLSYKNKNNKITHCSSLLKSITTYNGFNPYNGRVYPLQRASLLIGVFSLEQLRKPGVADVVKSPDSDHSVIKLQKRTPTKGDFTPHVNLCRPPRKTILLIDTIYARKVGKTLVAGVLNAPDSDRSLIKRWQSNKKAKEELEEEGSEATVVLYFAPKIEKVSTLIKNNNQEKKNVLTYKVYKNKSNNSTEYSKRRFFSSTRLTASSTRLTALGRPDRQHMGMRINACKSPPSASYGLCRMGIKSWFKGIKICKRSSSILSRSFSESKTIIEGSLMEPGEEEESTEKEAGPRININIVNNITINNNTNFNLFLDRLPNTIKVNGEVVDKTTHHILKKNNVFMPINGRFDGGVTKELEKLNFYQGKDLIAVRNELLASKKESEKSIKGRQFFIKLSNPKINFESIDFPIDVFLGGRLSEMFDYLTNKYINKLFTSKKSISIVDHRKRSFIYKKNNFYENIVESKGKKTQKLVSRTEIGKIETLYVGHKKTAGLSSLIIYNKETKENEIEWEGILRIEAHIKADKMPIIDGFRRGEYNQQEMTRQIIKELIRKFIEFKHPDNPSKIQKENLYRTDICSKWDNFLLELEKGTENMGTIDEHTLKNLLKKKEEKEYLFLDKEDKEESEKENEKE